MAEMYVVLNTVEDGEKRIDEALQLVIKYAGNEGSDHRMWVIAQMVKLLTRDQYDQFIHVFNYGADGPATYAWDEGVAP